MILKPHLPLGWTFSWSTEITVLVESGLALAKVVAYWACAHGGLVRAPKGDAKRKPWRNMVGCGGAMDSSAPWWSVKHTLVIFDEVHSILKDHQSTRWNLWIIFHSILWWFQPWHLECICVRGNCETSTVAEDLNHSNQYDTMMGYHLPFKPFQGLDGRLLHVLIDTKMGI